ncbi:hypothetical protein AXK12_03990 [Cephaloticoccus capnophilus]|uniref:Aldose 1-epimerase n=1 Tax=Cephaloticoccus capnophilus TaxID=1548208 RepID=A0A139SNH9_9BACT|nr:aldose epimerase family protein [Cephaloticoccus capnophilus]KXU36183.1 hypothetical protein AXK12_03990 [Cephaloticoccus capnophilus]
MSDPVSISALKTYTIQNEAGASADILNYGGIITALRVPDRAGVLGDVVLGFAKPEEYLAEPYKKNSCPYLGSILGRIAGRVTGGKLRLPNGRTYELAITDGPNHLHGGVCALDKRLWEVKHTAPDSITLFYHSPDGEEGYPGALDITLSYTLRHDNALVVETTAINRSDFATPLSLSQHSYFNLAGEGSGDVLDHEVQILADHIIPPLDDTLTLSGALTSVAGRADDLRKARRLGDVVSGLFLEHGAHYFLRAKALTPDWPELVARAYEPKSGRQLEVLTNDCGLQFYTGSGLNLSCVGKSGLPYGPHAGLCFECEGYPDGAHRPELGDILVHPGTPQRRSTIYAFSVR